MFEYRFFYKTCRSAPNKKIPETNGENRLIWQGSSGLFYCGKYLGDKNYCGPDEGPNCPACESLLKEPNENA